MTEKMHSVFDDPDEEDEQRTQELPQIERKGPGRPPKDIKPASKKEPDQSQTTHLSVNVDLIVDVLIHEIITERRRAGQKVTKQDLLMEALNMLFTRENKLKIAAAKAREKPQDTGDEG